MKSNACRDTRRQIDELDIGQRPGPQTAAHLEVCPECARFRRDRAELRDLVGSLERVAAPADFDMRLRARIATERSDSRQTFFARLFSTPALATAAVVVLAIGTVVWVAQRSGDRPSGLAANNSAPESTNQGAGNAGHVDTGSPAPVSSASDNGRELVAVSDVRRHGRVNRGPHRAGASDNFVRPAESISQNDPNQAFVNAPSRPVEVSLENDQGGTRKISLPPVSFGSQNLVNNRVPVTYSPNSRVW